MTETVTTTTVLDRLGGRRGLVDGAAPPLVFVAANAASGLAGLGDRALLVAAGVAAATPTPCCSGSAGPGATIGDCAG